MRAPDGYREREGGALWIAAGFEAVLREGGLRTFDDFLRADGARVLRERGYSSNAILRIGDRDLYLKRHRYPWLGVALRGAAKANPGRLSGKLELRNIVRFGESGFGTCTPVAAGDRRTGSRAETFLLTEAVDGHLPLEDLAAERYALPIGETRAREKRRLARSLGRYVRRLHDSGWNVRDLYLAHLLVRPEDPVAGFRMIDLHRARRRGRVSRRGVIRDLASLDHSAPRGIFTHTDRVRFLRAWNGGPMDAAARPLVRRVRARAARMAAHEGRQGILWRLIHAGVPALR